VMPIPAPSCNSGYGGGSYQSENLAWLFYKKDSNSGNGGSMCNYNYITCANTTGGAAPTGSCDSSSDGQTQQVSYGATYYFSS
jgi:hypothetical protein